MMQITEIDNKFLTVNDIQQKNIKNKIENFFVDENFILLEKLILKNIETEFPNLFQKKHDKYFYTDLFLENNFDLKLKLENFFKDTNEINKNLKKETNLKIQKFMNEIFLYENHTHLLKIKNLIVGIVSMLFSKNVAIDEIVYSILKEKINIEKFTKIVKELKKSKIFDDLNEKYRYSINLFGLMKFIVELRHNINIEKIKTTSTTFNQSNEDITKYHKENIKKFFSKKMLYFIYINLLYNNELFGNSLKIIDKYKYISELEYIVNKSIYLAINTLYIYPFYGKNHFKIVKNKIRKDYGINNKGWVNLKKMKLNKFSMLFANFSLFPVDLNTLNEDQNIELRNINIKMNNGEYLGFKDMKNEVFLTDEYIEKATNCLSKFINKKTLDMNINEISIEIESKIFKDFFIENRNKTIFYKKQNDFILNDEDFYNLNFKRRGSAIRKLNYTKLNCLIIKNIKNNGFYLYEGIDKLFFQKYNNMIYDDNFGPKLSLNLIKRYLEKNKNNENISLFINLLIRCLKVYKFEEFINNDDFIINIDKIDKNDKNLNMKIIDLYEKIFIFSKRNDDLRYLFLDMSLSIIQKLTGVRIYDYYSGMQFQSFCIELYLVNLFEKHYQVTFDENDENHMKFISKLSEKNFKEYEKLAKKSFDYFEEKYNVYIQKKQNTSNYTLLNNITTINENDFIVNDFHFKPMINKIDLIRNGIKMNNCLRNNYDYTKLESNTIVWVVTNSKNKNFRVNFELIINEEKLYIKDILTYCNKKNEIMEEEFKISLKIFKDKFFQNLDLNNIQNYFS